MGKQVVVLGMLLGLCVCAVGTMAQEKQGSGIAEWLQSLQKKIEQIVPKKQPPVTTAVAGVRGAKEDGQPKLYWKGRAGEEIVTEEELLKFKSGVDRAADGDTAAAVKELGDFMKQYPDSALIPDAKKTLDLLRAEAK